ncbi:MAG: PD-(D/E)XK nuclease-like domain-containing protein [Oenococcus oeni]
MLTIDELPKLNSDNYYDHDQDYKYLSATYYNLFLRNEAQAIAEIKDGWKPTYQNQTPLLVGNYFHSYFESKEAHQKFIDEHPEIISSRGATKGQLKRDYQVADEMIKKVESQSAIVKLLDKAKKREVIVTGEIAGANWKGKIDALDIDHGLFIDYKTNADFRKKHWVNDEDGHGHWADFTEAFGYLNQLAIYRELLKQKYEKEFLPVIIAVTKTIPSDIELLAFHSEELDEHLEEVKTNTPHIMALLNGEESPKFIDDGSEFSITHKQIKAPIFHEELIR